MARLTPEQQLQKMMRYTDHWDEEFEVSPPAPSEVLVRPGVFRLMDLPPELRLMIAEYVLWSENGMIWNDVYYKEGPIRTLIFRPILTKMPQVWTPTWHSLSVSGKDKPMVNIMGQICQTLRQQTRYLEYKVNTLHFVLEKSQNSFRWARHFPQDMLKNFKIVHIHGRLLKASWLRSNEDAWKMQLVKLHEVAKTLEHTNFHVIPIIDVNDFRFAFDLVVDFATRIETTHLGAKSSSSARTIQIHPVIVPIWVEDGEDDQAYMTRKWFEKHLSASQTHWLENLQDYVPEDWKSGLRGGMRAFMV